jgi:hypothetical protein
MTDQHPITPSPELFAEWFANSLKTLDRKVSRDDTGTTGLIAGEVAIRAARWAADMELEACCEHLKRIWSPSDTIDSLRAARRPKPPSLKEQALEAHGPEPLPEPSPHGDAILNAGAIERHRLVRRALEQLND